MVFYSKSAIFNQTKKFILKYSLKGLTKSYWTHVLVLKLVTSNSSYKLITWPITWPVTHHTYTHSLHASVQWLSRQPSRFFVPFLFLITPQRDSWEENHTNISMLQCSYIISPISTQDTNLVEEFFELSFVHTYTCRY